VARSPPILSTIQIIIYDLSYLKSHQDLYETLSGGVLSPGSSMEITQPKFSKLWTDSYLSGRKIGGLGKVRPTNSRKRYLMK